jgi:sulfatase maturation enzyme AslB (radical SAM superfamily)
MIDELRRRYNRQPREVSIETFALCNAACIFCPYPTLERKGVRLAIEVVYSLINQMRDWTEPFFVSPFKVNEPLLDDRLEEFCRAIEADCPQARLRIFTNGQPLTARHVEWIADLQRVEHLWISLNSTDPDEYGQLMKCSFSIVAEHLDQLHQRVVHKEFNHPVVLSRVLQGGALGQTLSDADCQFHREVLTRWPRFHTHLIKRDSWLGYTTATDSRIPNRPCGRWFELSITAQGKVVQCCMDGAGEYVYGDCAEQSLLEIYNSPDYRQFRERSSRKGIMPCESCSY